MQKINKMFCGITGHLLSSERQAGESIVFKLPKGLSYDLKSFAQETGTASLVVLVAAHALLLSKYAAWENIEVETCVEENSPAGRRSKDIRSLPLANKTIRDFLLEVENNYLSDLGQVDKQAEGRPLFQSILMIRRGIEQPGEIEIEAKVDKIDLLPDITGVRRAEVMAAHFANILGEMIKGPNKHLYEIDMLSEEEKHELLFGFNGMSAGYSKDKTVHQLFEEQVEKWPDNVAVIFDDNPITYKQLNQSANQLARQLREKGVRPDAIVGISAERSLQMIVGILAILKAGGAYLSVDPDYPKERIEFMLKDAGVKLLLSCKKLCNNFSLSARKLYSRSNIDALDVEVIDIEDKRLYQGDNDNLAAVNTPADLAYVIYTSGSTGQPKGVMVEHGSVINLANWQKREFNVLPGHRISQFATYSFDGAVGETVMALLNSATLVMLDRKNLSADGLITALNEKRINVFVVTPAMLARLDPAKLACGKELTVVSVGQECPVWLAAKWSDKCNFINAYGPTEYTVYSHFWRAQCGEVINRNRLPIGKAIDNTKTYILDKDLNPVPVGVVGEIYLSGAGIARGYLNRPNMSAMSFMLNPFAGREREFYEEVIFDSCEGAREELLKEGDNNNEIPRKRPAFFSNLSREKLLTLISQYDSDIVEKTKSLVKEQDQKDPLSKCLRRYFMEGMEQTYQTVDMDEKFLRFVLPFRDFKGLKGIDFGFGNGEVIKELTRLGADVKGIDLSPSFVQRGRQLGFSVHQGRCDIEPEKFQEEFKLAEHSQDFVISNLVLDRLENPMNFMRNVFLELKPGARFAIQTLLPIIGVDDEEEVEETIVYTTPHNQVAFGKHLQQDKLALVTFIRKLGGKNVKVSKLPYRVLTYTGLRTYQCWSFYGEYSPIKKELMQASGHDRFYKTGDLGRWLSDGNIEFIGRADQQVKIRGYRIELDEIESQLLNFNAIKAAVVIAKENGSGDKSLWAYIVAMTKLSVSELREYLLQRLPEYMVPSYFVQIGTMPMTASGKIDKKALYNINEQMGSAIEGGAAANETEKELILLLQEILGSSNISINDNFFVIGGDSIKTIKLVRKIREKFEAGISVIEIFEAATLREIADLILKSKEEKNKGGKKNEVLCHAS